MAFPENFHVSPHIAAILVSDTPHTFLVAVNRVLTELGAPVMRREESLEDVANRVRPLNCIIADCIQGYHGIFYFPNIAS